MGERCTIVVAWVDVEFEAVGWDTARIDLGERPKMEARRRARAVVWLNAGTAADVTRAQAFVADEGLHLGRVFVLPSDTIDPLRAARSKMMEIAGD